MACNKPAAGTQAAANNPGAGQDAGTGFGNSAGATGAAGSSVMLRDAGPSYGSFAQRPCPAASTLSYENFGANFFGTYCEPCHATTVVGPARNGALVGIHFDDLPSIAAQRQVIWNMAGDQNMLMPPVHKPSPEERVQLGEWLACGARAASAITATDSGAP
jgi:cytochrome c5